MNEPKPKELSITGEKNRIENTMNRAHAKDRKPKRILENKVMC